MINESDLQEIELRVQKTQKAPWIASIEGRDHESGSDIIITGDSDELGRNIEILGASIYDFDFIAKARQDIPRLIAEIRRLNADHALKSSQ